MSIRTESNFCTKLKENAVFYCKSINFPMVFLSLTFAPLKNGYFKNVSKKYVTVTSANNYCKKS